MRLLDRNRVLDAHTWEVQVMGDRATDRLIAECAASSDGAAYAHVSGASGGWDYGHTAGYLNRYEVRIAIPALTARSSIGDLATLLSARAVRITHMSLNADGRVHVALQDGDTVHRAADVEGWIAVNEALVKLEQGR